MYANGVLKVRQATHASITHFYGFSMHRLAAWCCPPGDTNWVAQFSLAFGFSGVVMLGLDFWCVYIIGMMITN